METRVHLVLSLTFRVKLKQQKRATVINDQRSKYQKNSIVNCFTKGVIVSWRKKHATVCTEQKLKRKGSNFHREKMQKHIYIDAKRWVDDSPVGLSNQQRQQSASQIHKKIFTNTKWWVDGGSMGLSGQQRQPSALQIQKWIIKENTQTQSGGLMGHQAHKYTNTKIQVEKYKYTNTKQWVDGSPVGVEWAAKATISFTWVAKWHRQGQRQFKLHAPFLSHYPTNQYPDGYNM